MLLFQYACCGSREGIPDYAYVGLPPPKSCDMMTYAEVRQNYKYKLNPFMPVVPKAA